MNVKTEESIPPLNNTATLAFPFVWLIMWIKSIPYIVQTLLTEYVVYRAPEVRRFCPDDRSSHLQPDRDNLGFDLDICGKEDLPEVS